MLQIDHVYEFLYSNIFKVNFDLYFCVNGTIKTNNINFTDVHIFTPNVATTEKIFFYDQEPLLDKITDSYLNVFSFPTGYNIDEIISLNTLDQLPFGRPKLSSNIIDLVVKYPEYAYKQSSILVTSEKSSLLDNYLKKYKFYNLYYFFHGFAALDWYRGFYALNYNKSVIKDYTYDYITFNRLVSNDRSYRCYFVSLLAEKLLLKQGQVSFGLPTEQAAWQEEIVDPNTKLSPKAVAHIQTHLPKETLVIDSEHVLGSASADIPRCANDSFWHIVTETVFYYDKLHLTEKIFKPIVSKQPFMLLGAPGNLAYLKSYGFKTFEGIIDESYDLIQDNDQRIEAVVAQLAWYCSLSTEEKQRVIEAIAPIVEYNFHHFYGEFKHMITQELLDNTKTLFKEIGYDDSNVAYDDIYRVLTN
jgi:hypothetical protein